MENFYENRYIWIWVIWKCTISRKDYWFHLKTQKYTWLTFFVSVLLNIWFIFQCAYFKITNIFTKCEVKITPKGTANPNESKQEMSKQEQPLISGSHFIWLTTPVPLFPEISNCCQIELSHRIYAIFFLESLHLFDYFQKW